MHHCSGDFGKICVEKSSRPLSCRNIKGQKAIVGTKDIITCVILGNDSLAFSLYLIITLQRNTALKRQEKLK